MVKKIPDGYHTATPYLYIRGAARAIEFYKAAFGAKERMRMPGETPDSIGHAEIEIGDSAIMLSDENLAMDVRSAETLGGSPISIVLYVEDVDSMVRRATDAGATLTRPPEDAFYGDRTATVSDPFGLVWHIHTHIEDVSPEEMERRATAAAQA